MFVTQSLEEGVVFDRGRVLLDMTSKILSSEREKDIDNK
jgi:hypothetical protein